jgi:hypothetical protein
MLSAIGQEPLRFYNSSKNRPMAIGQAECSAAPARPTPLTHLIQCFNCETGSRRLRGEYSWQTIQWRDLRVSLPYLTLKDACF